MTNIKKTKKGFTLMEMVTVVAIVAIVSTAGFVGVAVTLTNARNTQSRLSTENGYNFESEARESVKYIVPIGAHAAVEYYTPDGGEPNNEQTGNNNPATPNNDDTTTPGGGGSGNGGSVIPADGGSPAPATENDPPVTENDPPATPADNSGDSGNSGNSGDNDNSGNSGNNDVINNSGSTYTIDGTSTTTNIPGISAPQNNYYSDWGCVETRIQVPSGSDYSTVTIELQYTDSISRINTAWNGSYTVDYANKTITVTTTPGSDFGIQAISNGQVTVVSIIGS